MGYSQCLITTICGKGKDLIPISGSMSSRYVCDFGNYLACRLARVRPRSDRIGEKGRAGFCRRSQERDRTRSSDPVPTHQKQPGFSAGVHAVIMAVESNFEICDCPGL